MDKEKINKKGLLEFEISLKGVTTTQKLVFARYLSVMLKSGLTISESLEIIENQASGKFRKILKKVRSSVEAGNTLSDSLKKYPKVFSSLFISSVFAGEASGTMEQNLSNVAEQLRSEKELMSKIKGAMVYPVIVMVATFILGLAMAFLVLPKITPLFEGLDSELPITTKILIWTSDTIQNNGVWILLFSFLLFTFVPWILRKPFVQPITHFILLRIPVIKNIVYNLNIAKFCLTLASLLKSGLNIDEALDITKKTLGNYYFRKRLSEISEHVTYGTKLSDELIKHEEYFPKLVVSMVRVGEKSGNLTESLFYLAEFYEVEVDNSTKTLSTSIEPILLIAIGLVVGGMALSIITPIYQITGGVTR